MKNFIKYFLLCMFVLIPKLTLANQITCTNGDYNAIISIDTNILTLKDTTEIKINSTYNINNIKYDVINKSILNITNNVITPNKNGLTKIKVTIDFDNNISCETYLEISVISNNNKLKSLGIEGYNEFDVSESTQKYEITLPYNVKDINILGVAENENAQISGLGRKYLNEGINTFIITVTAEDGIKNTYTIIVKREAANNDTTLKNLFVEGYSLTPKFNSKVKEYTINVKDDVDKVNIIANPNSPLSKVVGDGETTLVTGKNKIIIKVTAENYDSDEYILYINKSSGQSSLKKLEIKGYDINFQNDVYTYNVRVNSDVYFLDINAIPNNNEEIEIIGNEDFVIGENNIIIRVSSKDKSSTTYKIIVNKINSNEENLLKRNNILLKTLLIIFIFSVVLTILLILIFIRDNFKDLRTKKKILKRIEKFKKKEGK